MQRRAAVAVALAVLLVPLVQAAATGARSPITVDDPVTDVAMAGNGRFAASNQDPEDRFTGDGDVPTWNLWNVDGSLRQSGSADPMDAQAQCPPANMQLEDCRTTATHIAVSGDGTRIAVASDKSGSTGDDLFTVFSDAGVLLSQVTVNAIITDVDVSTDGTRTGFTASTPNPQSPNNRGGLLQVFDGNGKNPLFSPSATGTTYTKPAVSLAFSADGDFLSVAAGAHHYYKLSQTTDHPHTVSGADAVDVDVSSTDGWAVAGFSNGFFGVYSKDIDQATPREYQKKEPGADGTGISAVAIRPDATAFVTGSSGGTLRYYRLDTAAPDQIALVASKTGLGNILDAEFSGDSRYLVVRAGGDVRMYRSTDGALDELWRDTRSGLGSSVAVDERGEHAIAWAGAAVVVYDAIHRLTATPSSGTQPPGTTANYTVSYRNDGNRMEDITLSASPPAGVVVSINPGTFTVVPGASRAIQVTVSLPSTRAPGATNIPLTHSLSGGADGTGTATLGISVPSLRSLVLEPAGDAATSLGVKPGELVAFDVVARNAGNVVETGTFAVTGLPSGWTAEVDPESINLQPGSFVNVTVGLTAPAGARNLDQADVRLVRGTSPGIDLTATVGAGFGVRLTGPAGLILAPGIASLLNLTVTNTGNAPDTLVVRLGNVPAGWQAGFLSGLPEHRVEDLGPGESSVVQATLRAPEGSATGVPVQVSATASSLGDPTKSATRGVLATVEEPTGSDSESSSTGDDGDNGIPGVPPALLLAGLAALALLVRRRKGG